MTEYTPVENRNGRYYKREDLYRSEAYGVNGAKFRACRYLIDRAVENGAVEIVSASSVLSPQAAMAAVVAEENGVEATIVLGATRPDSATKHQSVKTAVLAGAELNTDTRIAFNPPLQRAGKALAAERPGAWQLPYGITTPDDAPWEDVADFLNVGAPQVDNLPDSIETLVIPFGSGNTAAGVLYGLLTRSVPNKLRRVVLVGVGPDRMKWLRERLAYVGTDLEQLGAEGIELEHISLHGTFASYGDKMPETADGIVMHPTYEGKVVRYLDIFEPEWWTRRDGSTCFWIVGGPL